MLVKVLTDEHPDEIVVVFDAPGRTFRDDLDAEYKAGRKETPDLFVPQLPLIHEVVDALRIPTLRDRGRRGRRRDRHARRPEPPTPAATSSSSPATATRTNSSKTRTSRCSTTGAASPTTCSTTRPGSSSAPASPRRSTPSTRRSAATRATTCPGVPGIGEKTAAKLVTTYGDLEGIFAHLDELPPKQRQNLGEARDRVFLNRQMSLLVRDVAARRRSR